MSETSFLRQERFYKDLGTVKWQKNMNIAVLSQGQNRKVKISSLRRTKSTFYSRLDFTSTRLSWSLALNVYWISFPFLLKDFVSSRRIFLISRTELFVSSVSARSFWFPQWNRPLALRITPITPLLFSVKEAEMKSCTSFYNRHGEAIKSTRERGNRKRKLSERLSRRRMAQILRQNHK